ncbi:hypothetical protein NDU88_002811 [Pleurodeles waltl]|uniref:DRBM domain-containing protein n=1 Tax=Pleurodeles waltl TaxID=8319 RepID=A0AAV7RGF3_PLEWA|nr:hypothetical protein NDU88_002811 [Pleurodeles waltl]
MEFINIDHPRKSELQRFGSDRGLGLGRKATKVDLHIPLKAFEDARKMEAISEEQKEDGLKAEVGLEAKEDGLTTGHELQHPEKDKMLTRVEDLLGKGAVCAPTTFQLRNWQTGMEFKLQLRMAEGAANRSTGKNEATAKRALEEIMLA